MAVALLLAYTAVLLTNAFAGRRVSTDLEGYYVGGRNLSGLVLGISFFATFASTNSYIGHAGKGYAYGIPWLAMAATLIVFTYLSWRIVAPRLRAIVAEHGALTIPDYLGVRFLGRGEDHDRHLLRIASALVIVFASLLYLVAIFKGAGHLFQMFLAIPYTAAVGVTLVIVVAYTSIGGFLSVVRTDVVQGLLMVAGSLMMFYFVTTAAGGVGAIAQLADRPDTSFLFELNGGIAFVVLMGISLSGALKLMVDPRQLSRFFALKDDSAIKTGVTVALIGLVLVQFSVFPIGVYAHLLMDNVADTDLIVPTLIGRPDVFPVWAGDFLVVAIVAAAMSSIDSVLLVAASTLYKNLIAPFHRTERSGTPTRAVNATRLAVVGFAALAAFIALNPPGDIVEITIFSGSLYAVCFFPAVVLGLYWRRGSAWAVISSMVLGVATLLAWLAAGLGNVLHEVFPGLAVSLIAYTTVSLVSPRTAQSTMA